MSDAFMDHVCELPGGSMRFTSTGDWCEAYTLLAEWTVCLWLCLSPPVPPRPRVLVRGTPEKPCEYCGQSSRGATLHNGWYRCNVCGEPGQ